MTPANIQLIAFVSIFFFFYLIESFQPVRPWTQPRWKRFAFHMTLSVLNSILMRLVAAAPVFLLIIWTQEHRFGIAHWMGLTGIVGYIATYIVYDFYDYWWHRVNHQIPFLWRFHKAHHIDTHVDITTSLRFHPGELVLSTLAKIVFVCLWGPSLWGYMIAMIGISAHSQFHHTNFTLPEGVERIFRWVHMTPRLHASHHTVTPRTRNANFSTIFLIWDRLFGTLREPDDQEMQTLGLKEGRKSSLSGWALLKAPFYSEEYSSKK